MLNATLVSRFDFGDDLCILRIGLDGGVPPFLPGQFVRLGLYERDAEVAAKAKLIRRAYSIASSPHERDWLEFYVVKVREGRLTPEVWELGPGDRLWVDTKIQGEFTLEGLPRDAELLLIATGTGIAPYVSMLRTYAGEGRWRRFTVVHGARRIVDLGYREELEAQARRYPEVRYVPVVSREPEVTAWDGLRGRVLQVLETPMYERLTGAEFDAARSHVFLCGNPDMVQAARALLEPRGFRLATRKQPGTIHTERYW